jgi:nitroimidazol reductase NimA-like FMN-containing flavoprotein (pyridoxamine 5'-phosphate oxidase superfamily)
MKMRRAELEIRDKPMIKAILDMCKVINVGLFDDKYPYVFPTNYGYIYEEDLIFFTHHAPAGHKLDLFARNPHVCVTCYSFADHIKNPRSSSHSRHDYRSVMAFGIMEELKPGTPEYRLSLKCLHENNGRIAADSFTNRDHSAYMRMFKITCHPEDVTGKSQDPLAGLHEIPLPTEPADDAAEPKYFR